MKYKACGVSWVVAASIYTEICIYELKKSAFDLGFLTLTRRKFNLASSMENLTSYKSLLESKTQP